MWYLLIVISHKIPPAFREGVHIFIPSAAIGPVPSLSGHTIAYRWRSLPRVRRHRASSPQCSSSNKWCVFRYFITYHHGSIINSDHLMIVKVWVFGRFGCVQSFFKSRDYDNIQSRNVPNQKIRTSSSIEPKECQGICTALSLLYSPCRVLVQY